MRNQAILISTLLFAAGSAWAGESLLENAAKQTAVDSVKSAAPGAVQKVETSGQTLEKANAIKESAEKTPEAIQEHAKEAATESVKQKVDAVVPEEAKKTGETIKSSTESANNLKKNASNAPKVVKEAAKQKAAEKALDLLR